MPDPYSPAAGPARRAVIVHYHLFKNAGSTVDGILERNFPDGAHGHVEGRYPWSTVTGDEIRDFARAHPAVRAISSHQARLPLPEDAGIDFVPILFLRHPIDRFGSVYEFERREPADSLSPSVPIARNGGLAAFARWVVSSEGTAVCRNFQVIHLAGEQVDMRYARATHADYPRALRHLTSLPSFGLVERFEESLALGEAQLRPHFGDLEYGYQVRNSSPGRQATLDERIARIERELGPALYRALLEHNALDMLLYEEAQRLFEARRLASLAQAASVASAATLPPAAAPAGILRRAARRLMARPLTPKYSSRE